jgi:hypothetical protein
MTLHHVPTPVDVGRLFAEHATHLPRYCLGRLDAEDAVAQAFLVGRYLGAGGGGTDLPLVTAAPATLAGIPLERTITPRILATCTVVDRDRIPD